MLVAEMDRLGRLTGHLNFAVLDQPAPALAEKVAVDVCALLSRVVMLYEPEAERLGICVSSEVPASVPPIQADPDALTEVFTNLVDNAIKFTPSGGRVSVSAGMTQHDVWIRVSDTGMGLTPEEQKQLFKRFYRGDPGRSRPHGVGLGLAITQELVQAHGGSIRVSSAPDQGTTFTVEIPR
jgi:two-component system phosphate regulon sensor histidine kinase PhoR